MKNEIKGFICGVVSATLITGAVSAVGIWDSIDVLKNDVKVVVNGENITADNFLYNDTTYLPLRAVSEALGQSVEYDETSNTAFIGERKEENIMKSKHIPPKEIINNRLVIRLENGIYYIWAQQALDLAENKGVETNEYELYSNKEEKTLIIDGESWEMTIIDDTRYIPYDTFVDEIEPLLK